MKNICVYMLMFLMVISFSVGVNSQDLYKKVDYKTLKNKIFQKQLKNNDEENLYKKPGSESEEKLFQPGIDKLKKKNTVENKIFSNKRKEINNLMFNQRNEMSSFKRSILGEVHGNSFYSGTDEVFQMKTSENSLNNKKSGINQSLIKKPFFRPVMPVKPAFNKPVFEKPEGFEKPEMDDPESFERPNFIPGQDE